MKIGDKVKVVYRSTTDEEVERLKRDFLLADPRAAQQGREYRPSPNESPSPDLGKIIGEFTDDDNGRRFLVRVFVKNGPPRGRVQLLPEAKLQKA